MSTGIETGGVGTACIGWDPAPCVSRIASESGLEYTQSFLPLRIRMNTGSELDSFLSTVLFYSYLLLLHSHLLVYLDHDNQMQYK